MSIARGAALALGLLVAGPAAAHVTLEAQQAPANSIYRSVLCIPHRCDGAPAPAPARAALQAALPHATPAERLAMQRALTIANTTCTSGDPVAGARIAANLARIAGRIEGQVGIAATDLDALA